MDKKLWKKVTEKDSLRLEVVGHRLLVTPLEAESNKETNIDLLKSTKDSDQRAQVYGVVLSLGALCFKDLAGTTRQLNNFHPNTGMLVGHNTVGTGEAWCKVGDVILYHPYSYAQVRDPITFEFRDDVIIVNDQDVYAVVGNLDAYTKAIRALQKEDEVAAKEKAANVKSRY